MNKILKVKCPTCEKEFEYYQSESRPFCSERCRQIDLGHWFQETYVVPTKEVVPGLDNTEIEVDNENEESNDSEYH